jgi:hypothetical protein
VMNDPIKYIPKGPTSSCSLDNPARPGPSGWRSPNPGQYAARDPDMRQGVGGGEGGNNYRPGQHQLRSRGTHLELDQDSLAKLSSSKTDAEELCGWNHEDISDLSLVEDQILDQDFTLLLSEAEAHRTNVDEDSVALKRGQCTAAPTLIFMVSVYDMPTKIGSRQLRGAKNHVWPTAGYIIVNKLELYV